MQSADSRAHVVDARGLLCPQPMVMARIALRGAECGALIEIWATDPLAPLDILDYLCARGSTSGGQQ